MATGQITGIVKNVNDGTPIAGVRVQILTDIAILDTQITDVSGSFTTVAIESGTYNILVSKDGFQTGHYLHIVVPDTTITLASLQLTPITFTTNLYGWNPTTSTWDKILVNEGALTTSNAMDLAANQGRYYLLDTGVVNVGANHIMALEIDNPIASTKILRISRVTGSSNDDTTITIMRNSSFLAAGTAVTPHVTNFSSTDSSAVALTCKWITQPTNPVTGGANIGTFVQNGDPIELDFSGRIVIGAGKSIVIIVTNNSNQTHPVAMTVAWREDTA
ncbi:hypothetical protein UF75_1176 [Desulfosporosinus sp. I2]|uniref:carboxypeptidase-like regulatory domain-containing protein n=1 Tax=Desulfosporosinus sp. I2 TaxID=1617025 RepID=UPI0005EE4FE7|nr:carboxypeptidase-like regulatory domain-containing protein [Desulfosporosinus sp. I2]KJR48378.1 hypothetical protein UF75_1176 [Desulfosporosinus sp. I2]